MVIFNSYAKYQRVHMIGDGSNIAKQGSTTLLKKKRPIRNHSLGSSPSIAPLHGAGRSSCFTQHILIWFIWRFPKSWGYSTTIIQVPMVLGTPMKNDPHLNTVSLPTATTRTHQSCRFTIFKAVTGDSPNYPWPMRTPWPYRVHWHLGFVVLGVHRRTLAMALPVVVTGQSAGRRSEFAKNDAG